MRLGAALGQTPAAYEHEPNGVIENDEKLGEGFLRVFLFSLKAQVQGRTPCDHRVFAWLSECPG
eukprot:12047360-Alexandrium_andersonii.AAC.1